MGKTGHLRFSEREICDCSALVKTARSLRPKFLIPHQRRSASLHHRQGLQSLTTDECPCHAWKSWQRAKSRSHGWNTDRTPEPANRRPCLGRVPIRGHTAAAPASNPQNLSRRLSKWRRSQGCLPITLEKQCSDPPGRKSYLLRVVSILPKNLRKDAMQPRFESRLCGWLDPRRCSPPR